MKYGFDISENNGDIDFNAAVNQGLTFVYIRAGYGKGHEDSKFAENVAAAHAAGLKVGAYYYSYAMTPQEAQDEAAYCRDIIDRAGCLLELPVFFDMEDADGYKKRHGFNFSHENITEICRAFVGNLGLDCGIYASYDWLSNYIDWQGIDCAVWNAEWGNRDDIQGYVWQFTDSFDLAGKQVDGDVMYD